MKAIVYTKYGAPDVFEYRDVEKPSPRENEILVKVHASSVNPLDWHYMRGKPLFMRLMGAGVFKPSINILGADLAGVVEDVGSSVAKFKPGDDVYGATSFRTGLGTFAEYVSADIEKIVHKPDNISFAEAAAVPIAAVTALQAVRDDGELQLGQKVLINGASGGVGTYTIQIAKAMGGQVTAVCSSRHIEIAKRLGADHVIDYTQENFTEGGKQYDLIIAANGYHPIKDYLRCLAPGGKYVVLGGSLKQLFEAMTRGKRLSKQANKNISTIDAVVTVERLKVISDLLEAGKLRSEIDSEYTLIELPTAMAYIEDGHARGKVVINVT